MPAVTWPISPWLIAAPALALVVVCLVLLLVAWRFRQPWLVKVVEILVPDDPDDPPRRGRR
jgi:hypothetical protein